MNKLKRRAEIFLNKMQKKQAYRRFVSIVAVILVFTVTYSLILPVVALERDKAGEMPGVSVADGASTELACSFAVHKHTDKCYEEQPVYDADGHQTDTKKVLICGKEDYVVHEHDASCYQDGELVCQLPEIEEHVHDKDCYKTERELTCGKEETDGHTHSDKCYKIAKNLICGKEEHLHNESCYSDVVVGIEKEQVCGYEDGEVIEEAVWSDPVYDEETGELLEEAQIIKDAVIHYHDDECLRAVEQTERQLVCGKEEHKHSNKCYKETKELICKQKEGEAHHHTADCYKEKKTLTCGKLELHTHTVDCYERGPKKESPIEMGWAWYEEDADGTQVLSGDPHHLVCGKTELLAHQHDGSCFSDADNAADGSDGTVADKDTADGSDGTVADKDTAGGSDGTVADKDMPDGSGGTSLEAEEAEDGEYVEKEYDLSGEEKENSNWFEMINPDEEDTEDSDGLGEDTEDPDSTDADNADEDSIDADADTTDAGNTGADNSDADTTDAVYTRDIPVIGAAYTLHIEYGTDSGIPEDAVIEAAALSESRADYDAWCDNAFLAIDRQSADTGRVTQKVLGLFDLTIHDSEGNELQPEAPVKVTVAFDESDEAYSEYTEAAESADAGNVPVYAVHFPGSSADDTMSEPGMLDSAIKAIAGKIEKVVKGETTSADLEVIEAAQVTQTIALDATQNDAQNNAQSNVQNGAQNNAQNDTQNNAQNSAQNNTQNAAQSDDDDDEAGAGTNSVSAADTDSDTNISTTADTRTIEGVQFEVSGLSVYAVVYTVDFHYDVNGQTYDFSIQGGSCTSFRELVEALSITEEDPQVFVEDVESMVFSSPDLVSVSKVEEDTTAGAIKERLGLACEYSGELTEEEIAELDAKEVQAGDWALISLKAFNTEETLTVTMNTGEVFVIKVTDAQDPLGIDDRTLSFVYLPNSNSTSGYAVMSSKGNGNTLTSRNVSYTTKNGVEYCAKEASVWIFEYDADQEAYYISNGYHSHEEEGMYLTFKNGNLDLVQGKENATPVKVERDNDGNYLIGDGNGGYLSYQNASFSRATNTNNAKFRFCLAEGSGSDSSHKATLTSAADLQPGQSIVIYQRVLQSDNTYLYYAIDGDGNAQKVWNSSDSVYWRGDISVEWEIVDAGSGYYYFYNPTTKTYLAPKGTGAIVVDLEDDNNPYDYGMDDVSLSLPGKKAGTYTSQIANWDYQRNVTDGLSITQSGGTTTVTSLLLPNSQEFYFAVRDPIVQGELTEVDTVDSISKGIKMTMYDFSGDYNYDYGVRLAYMNTVMGTPNWNAGVYRPNIASKTLGEDGYPVMTTGKSLGLVFEPPSNASNNYKSDPTYNVNHLFLQNIYDSTGFFRYSAFENFARLNTETGNFKVYEQIGTPSREGESDENAYYMQRGNFMPYNDLDLTAKKTNNIRPQDGQGLENANPRKGEELYRLKNRSNWDNLNYFFGMIMEAKFQQYPEGRNDRGDPVRYEFNGDDDMWIYIDGVLMLDLGGVHDAFQGYIDFTNGNIHVYNDNNATTANTTIKQRFWEAHRFPDGEPWTDWNDSRVSEYFVGNTLKEYSTHDFKMFYMERGAGASNLEMQFNLLTILEDSFRVTKEMPKTINEQDVQGGLRQCVVLLYREEDRRRAGDILHEVGV